MTPKEELQSEGRTLLRFARELREWLSTAKGEPEADSMLRDVDVMERVGRWLSSAVPITATDGIPSAGSAALPSIGTCRPPVEG